MNMVPAPELMVFISVALAPDISFFHSMALAPVRFYTLIFSVVLVCIKLNGK